MMTENVVEKFNQRRNTPLGETKEDEEDPVEETLLAEIKDGDEPQGDHAFIETQFVDNEKFNQVENTELENQPVEMAGAGRSEEKFNQQTNVNFPDGESSDSPPPLLEDVQLVDSPPLLLPTSPEEVLNLDNPESVFTAARCGEFSEVVSLLKENPDKWPSILSYRDSDGHSLLHWAALFNSTDFVSESYLQATNKADWVSCRSRNGQTPIMWACIKGHLEVMKVLFHKCHAHLSMTDSLKADCMILAVQHHQYNAVLLLHKWQGERNPFDSRDSGGCSPVHWAAYKGDLLMLRLLHYLRADMNLIDYQGMSPLHRAAGEGWTEAALFLREKCEANPKLVNNKNETPIDIAKRLGNKPLMIALGLSDEELREDGGKKWMLSAGFVVNLSVTIICFFNDLFLNTGFWFRAIFIPVLISIVYTFSDLLVSDPGYVPKRRVGESAIEDLQTKLDGAGPIGDEGLNRICVTCWESKDVERRMKHCSSCDRCVESFDHHCGWINNCVAEKNHREFVVMVFSVWLGIVMWVFTSICQAIEAASFSDFLWNKPLILPLWIVYMFVTPWLTILLGAQLRSIAINLNTNEQMNMHRYSHFWEGPLNVLASSPEEPHHHHDGACNHAPRPERRFRNPFDQGGIVANCKYFWFRKGRKYRALPQEDGVEMTHVV